MPISEKPITIEITYSNLETSKLGVKIGDQFTAYREYYLKTKNVIFEGKPQVKIVRVMRQACYFRIEGNEYDCVAYKCQHDDDVMIPVTTCKIVKPE